MRHHKRVCTHEKNDAESLAISGTSAEEGTSCERIVFNSAPGMEPRVRDNEERCAQAIKHKFELAEDNVATQQRYYQQEPG